MPPAPLVLNVTLFVTLPALVADVAVAALPPMDNPAAVPVNPVPAPLNCVLAVMVVPVIAPAVEPPIVTPLIVPPVMATELAFCVDIVPRPDTAVFAIAIAVFAAAVNCP